MLNQILNPRFSSALTRLLAMKTGGSPMPTMAPELTPGLEVNNLNDRSMHFLRGERLGQGFCNVGAPGAGNYTRIQLVNPVGSSTLVIVDQLRYWTDTAAQVLLDIVATGTIPTPTGAGVFRATDSRWWSQDGTLSTRSAAQLQYQNTAVVPTATNSIYNLNVTGTMGITFHDVPCYAVLRPGSYLQIALTVVATPVLYTNWWWREKPLSNEESATG